MAPPRGPASRINTALVREGAHFHYEYVLYVNTGTSTLRADTIAALRVASVLFELNRAW